VRDAVFVRAVLGRPTVGNNESAIRQRLQMIFPILDGFLDDGISDVAQVILVLPERIVLPEMLGGRHRQ
jgi:hypothetical protein